MTSNSERGTKSGRLVSSSRVRAHILSLQKRGMPLTAIAKAAPVDQSVIKRLARPSGYRKRIPEGCARVILAVKFDPSTVIYVSPEPVQERLKLLLWVYGTPKRVEQMASLSSSRPSRILGSRKGGLPDRVTVWVARAIFAVPLPPEYAAKAVPPSGDLLACLESASTTYYQSQRELVLAEAAPVKEHISLLHDRGLSYAAISVQAGLPKWQVGTVVSRAGARIKKSVADAILAVPVPDQPVPVDEPEKAFRWDESYDQDLILILGSTGSLSAVAQRMGCSVGRVRSRATKLGLLAA